ncbi:hypothetical protein [Streptomyces sp. NPDC020681]|uniref:Rv1733c family protein n=1 Tax=Streptomyces sp. NPDC020681 TaxID=3365083 RepID=UPI0037A473DA
MSTTRRGQRRQRRANPLRRRSDAVRAWTTLVLGICLILGAPAAGLAAGWSAYASNKAAAVQEAASKHRVRAELTKDAPKAIPSADEGGGVEKHRVPVRWPTAGTGYRTGVALVDAGMERGDRTDIWLDSQGRVTASPKPDADIWLAAFAIGSGAAAVTAAIVLIVRLTVRWTADRHRMAEWEQEWALVGPKWSGHRT